MHKTLLTAAAIGTFVLFATPAAAQDGFGDGGDIGGFGTGMPVGNTLDGWDVRCRRGRDCPPTPIPPDPNPNVESICNILGGLVFAGMEFLTLPVQPLGTVVSVATGEGYRRMCTDIGGPGLG